MAFQRDFNTLLNEILVEYRNAFPGEVTTGSVLYVKAACTASMLWGLYQTMDKVADQMFIESANRAFKEKHAAEFGIVTTGKTDAQIVDEVLAVKRSKMSGGNKYDYVFWAKEVTLDDEFITHAQVVELAQGEGTFDIVVIGSQNEGRASAEICAKIYANVQAHRPIGSGFSWGVRVCTAIPHNLSIKIRGTGSGWNQILTQDAIKSYINSLLPREPLYRSQLMSIMHQYGADTAEIISPATDDYPPESMVDGLYSMFRVNNITIEE